MKRACFLAWIALECVAMFSITVLLLANAHKVIPALKLKEWSVPFLVVAPAALMIWLTIYMHILGARLLRKDDASKDDSHSTE